MKINNRLFLLFIISVFACSKQERTILSGRIKHAEGVTTFLEELRITSSRTIDSAEIDGKGNFRFRISLNQPGYYQLNFSDGKSLTLLLSPGEKLKLKADFDNFYQGKNIEGSENSARVNELHDTLRFVISQLTAIRKEYKELNDSDKTYSKKRDSLETLFAQIQNNHHKYSIQFILEDIASLANIAALYQEYSPGEYVFKSQHDIQFFKLVSDTLFKYYPKVRQVKILKDNYQAMMTAYQKEKLLQQVDAVEMDIPDLLLPDTKGRIRSLSSLKGKIVLLTFWSVNQQESIANVVELKKVYKKYHNKGFEVYQVSVDKAKPAWLNALKFEEIQWVSVIDTVFPSSATRTLFNVNNLPLNYLINSDQSEIIAKNISPEALNRTLSNLIDK
jgi:hypothetical protein